jgi:hypothetical protein
MLAWLGGSAKLKKKRKQTSNATQPAFKCQHCRASGAPAPLPPPAAWPPTRRATQHAAQAQPPADPKQRSTPASLDLVMLGGGDLSLLQASGPAPPPACHLPPAAGATGAPPAEAHHLPELDPAEAAADAPCATAAPTQAGPQLRAHAPPRSAGSPSTLLHWCMAERPPSSDLAALCMPLPQPAD